MIASGTIIIDGQTYRKGDVIHDLGGWDCNFRAFILSLVKLTQKQIIFVTW